MNIYSYIAPLDPDASERKGCLMVSRPLFRSLWAAFAIQVAGRLLDLRWHLTHSGFETAQDQLQAHWLVWLGTLLVLIVAAMATRNDPSRGERRGYTIILVGNAAYGVVAVIHFFQHLDHLEVDWAHALLLLTSVIGAAGLFMAAAAVQKARIASLG